MIVTLTMVRNEADIVEPFVRHNASLVDAMIILDNGSSDKTADILFSLIREGLPVSYVFDPDPCFAQDIITTALLHAALGHFLPQFLFPLDADEFIVGVGEHGSRARLAEALSPDVVSLIPWITYVPSVDATAPKKEPLARMGLKRCFEPKPVHKAIIPARLALQCGLSLKQGNHDVISSIPVDRRMLHGFGLAHFPIRTVEQLRSKAIVGWLANLAKGDYSLFDWYSFYCMFKQGVHIDDDQIAALAIRKDLPSDIPSPSLECVPPFTVPPRSYPIGSIDCISLLLSYCEDLMALQERASHPLRVRRSTTMEERRQDYAAQLANGTLGSLVERTGLSVIETSALVRIVLGLPSPARLGLVGASAEPMGRFVTHLHSLGTLKDMPELVTLRRSESPLEGTVSPFDLILGDITDSGFQPSDGPRLLQLVREGGLAVFLSVDRCSITRELVETSLSPNTDWTEKALLRGMFYARSTRQGQGYV